MAKKIIDEGAGYIRNNEHPQKLKRGGGIKKMLDGGVVPTDGGGDDEKKKAEAAKKAAAEKEAERQAALVYNPEAFRAALAKRDSEAAKLKTKNIAGMGKRIAVPGAISDNVIPLTNTLKSQIPVLEAYRTKNKLTTLTKAQVDAALREAKLGDGDAFFNYVNDYNAYRGITPVEGVDVNREINLTTYGDSNRGGGYRTTVDPVYDENIANLFVPQQKAKGGKIKGYIAGGDIREDMPTASDTSGNRKYSTKAKDYVHDFAMGAFDGSLNGLGLENAIKDKDYKTKAGSKWNAGARGMGTIGRSTTGAVVNYFYPGLGTGINAVLGAGSKITGEDKGIDKKYIEQQDKVSKGIDAVGSFTSMAGGMKKNKKKDDVAPEKNATPEAAFADTVDADIEAGVFDSSKKEMPINQKPGFYDGFDLSTLTPQQLIEFDSLQTPDERREFLSQGLANGGKIKGAGTGTSDSIKAEMEDGGFIVPAKNAKIAEQIRAKYLGDPKDKEANLKEGDTPVKVSNGEHYFTEAEADLLRAKGIDLDALAPDAESSDEMADGGPIEDVKKKKVLELQKEIVDAENVLKKYENDNGTYASGLKKNARARIERAQKESRKAMQDEAYSKDDISGKYFYDEKKAAKLSEDFTKKKTSEPDFKANKFTIDNTVDSNIPSTKQTKKQENEQMAKSDAAAQDLFNKEFKVVNPSEKTAAKSSGKSKSVAQSTNKTGLGIQRSLGLDAISTIPTNDFNADQAQADALMQKTAADAQAKLGMEPTGIAQTPAEKQLEADAMAATNKMAADNASPKAGSGLGKNFDLGTAFSVYQVGQGLASLSKAGSRPVDQIDPDFASSVERAKTDALSGLSPLERSIAERNIERTRRAETKNIIGLSGGNAGTALANIGAAGIRADDATRNLAATSEALRLQKQAYADSLIGRKAGMSRQLFEDKLNAFNTNQQAGAALLGAGIQNLVGESRYKKELAAQEEARRLGNLDYSKLG